MVLDGPAAGQCIFLDVGMPGSPVADGGCAMERTETAASALGGMMTMGAGAFGCLRFSVAAWRRSSAGP